MTRFIIHTITKQKNIKLSLDRWGEKRHATKRPQNGNKKITTRKYQQQIIKFWLVLVSLLGLIEKKKFGHP